MQKKLFYNVSVSLFLLGLSCTITPLSSPPAIIEKIAQTNTPKFFYIPCEKLPSEGLQEIKLKRDKITLTEAGTAKLLEKCKKTKTGGTFLVKHPISKKDFVLQITFNATEESKSPGIVLPPYTDIRIYGIDKQCPKDTEQFIVDLFTPKSQAAFYLKFGAAIGLAFIISKLTGISENVTHYYYRLIPTALNLKLLADQVDAISVEQDALTTENDSLTKNNGKLLEDIDSQKKAIALITNNLQILTASENSQAQQIAALKEALARERATLESKKAALTENERLLDQKKRETLELTQRLNETSAALVSARTTTAPRRHQAAHMLGAGAHSGESEKTTSLSEIAKHYFFQMRANKALVTIEDLRAQGPDLNVALDAWLPSKQILILNHTELLKNNCEVFTFLTKNRSTLYRRFLVLNDSKSKVVIRSSTPGEKPTRGEAKETILVSNLLNIQIPTTETEPLFQLCTLKSTHDLEDNDFDLLFSDKPLDHGFVDGRLQSEIKADFENLHSASPQIREINDFFELQIVFTS